MTDMADVSVRTVDTTVKRHPITAVLWGIVGGIGVSLFLIGRAQIAFGKWTMPIIIIVCMVILNLLWAYLGPAKKPKGPPPVQVEPEPVTMDEAGFGTGSEGTGSGEVTEPAERDTQG
jgi:hypothetical protein